MGVFQSTARKADMPVAASRPVKLCVDVLRIIFEFAAFSDTATGARLCRVSKTVNVWLNPGIFKFLVLDNYSFGRLYHAHERTPPPFGHHVQTIAVLNTCCVRAPSGPFVRTRSAGPFVCTPYRAYQLDMWWLPPDSHAPLPELHVISACCYGTSMPENEHTSISRFWLGGACKFYDTLWEHFPVLTHLGFSGFAAKRGDILQHVNNLLHRAPPSLRLQSLCLRLYTPAPDLRATGIWTTLRDLREERILLLHTTDLLLLRTTNISALNDEEKKLIFERTRDHFFRYVSGVEDPWAVGERVYVKE